MAAEMLSAQHNAGMALLRLGRAEDAGLVLEGVIQADPEAAESWAALGVCMAELGQPEAALACQRQVVALRGRPEEGGGTAAGDSGGEKLDPGGAARQGES